MVVAVGMHFFIVLYCHLLSYCLSCLQTRTAKATEGDDSDWLAPGNNGTPELRLAQTTAWHSIAQHDMARHGIRVAHQQARLAVLRVADFLVLQVFEVSLCAIVDHSLAKRVMIKFG
jgi:hypothetical protein